LWLKTEPRINDTWYYKLTNSSNIQNNIANDLKDVIMTVRNGNCLTLKKEGNEKKYSFTNGDCNEKKSVVCHISNVKSTSSELLPSFPCMSQNSTSRRKRSTSLDEFKSEGLGENEIGKGNIVLVIQETLIYQIIIYAKCCYE
jgi:hypothetical protein